MNFFKHTNTFGCEDAKPGRLVINCVRDLSFVISAVHLYRHRGVMEKLLSHDGRNWRNEEGRICDGVKSFVHV